MKKDEDSSTFSTHWNNQLYEKGKEEMEKKKNIKLWNYYHWQLMIFSPKSWKWCFTCVHTSMAMNKKRERTSITKVQKWFIWNNPTQISHLLLLFHCASTSALTPIYFKQSQSPKSKIHQEGQTFLTLFLLSNIGSSREHVDLASDAKNW